MNKFVRLLAVFGALLPNFAHAQQAGIVGVWRSSVQYSAYDPQTGVQSSVMYTTAFKADGSFRTEILSQGGDGRIGAAGVFVITGHYNFADGALRYRQETYTVCVVNQCVPQRPPTPNFYDVQQTTFQTDGQGHAMLYGMNWTRIA